MDVEVVVSCIERMQRVPVPLELGETFPFGLEVVFCAIILSAEDGHILGHVELVEVEGVH